MVSVAGGHPGEQPVAEATVEAEESPSATIPIAVAAVADRTAVDLPPLGDVVDPDGIDRLFGDDPTAGHLAFRYAGFDVVLRGDDVIEVYETETPRSRQ